MYMELYRSIRKQLTTRAFQQRNEHITAEIILCYALQPMNSGNGGGVLCAKLITFTTNVIVEGFTISTSEADK